MHWHQWIGSGYTELSFLPCHKDDEDFWDCRFVWPKSIGCMSDYKKLLNNVRWPALICRPASMSSVTLYSQKFDKNLVANWLASCDEWYSIVFLFSGLQAVAIGGPCFFYTKTLLDKNSGVHLGKPQTQWHTPCEAGAVIRQTKIVECTLARWPVADKTYSILMTKYNVFTEKFQRFWWWHLMVSITVIMVSIRSANQLHAELVKHF